MRGPKSAPARSKGLSQSILTDSATWRWGGGFSDLAIAAVKAQPVADQRTHARPEERTGAVEGAVPIDLDGFGNLALGRAFFEPDEERGQPENPDRKST